MKITVHEEKVRAELLTAKTYRDASHRLTECEVQVLISLLHGGKMRDFAKRVGKSEDNISGTLHRVRTRLNVRNNIELAYIAYERGYVVIEEGA